VTPEKILALYSYFLCESDEGQYLHDPDSAGSNMVRLWQDIVRFHCDDEAIQAQIDSMIEEAKSLALTDFEIRVFDDR